jgi:hypothetical protein
MEKLIPIFQGNIKDGRLILKDELRFKNYVKALAGEVDLTIQKHRSARSLKANAYYFGVVLAVISFDTGFTVDEVHDIFKRKFLSYSKAYKGKNFQFTRSTAKLNSFDFSEYIGKIKNYVATELNIIVPEAGEFEPVGYDPARN